MKQNLRFLMLALLCAVFSTTWAETKTGTITFGSGSGATSINNASVTGNDSQGNTWTITTVGTTSYTPNSGYAQVGSSKNPATSITFTTTLAAEQNITSFEAKFGGFSGTAGTVTLKVGDTSVGTGSLNATNDVTVSSTTSAQGTVLTVTVTNISKGVKCYYISYTYEEGSSQPTGDTYELLSSQYNLVEGDYIIAYSGKAMSNEIVSNKLGYKEPTIDEGNITTDDKTIVWHIAPSETEGYWTIKSLDNNEYVASTSNDNEAITTTTLDDKALWSTSGTYSFTNKAKGIGLQYQSYNFYCTTIGSGVFSLYRKHVNVATPSFTPSSGNFTEEQSVTITCETPGVSIYYTTDGTTPTSSSTLYEGPITISETTTLKAIAIIADDESEVAEATITILTPMTISEVRTQNTGTTVFTQGVVTSIYNQTAYIQDATAAICLYGDPNLTVGDEITVKGDLVLYHGLLEISGPICNKVTENITVEPTPMTIADINSSTNQGWLVKIENATVSSISNKDVTLAQGDNTILVRFNVANDINFVVNDIITLTGNIGNYDGVQIANPRDVEIKGDKYYVAGTWTNWADGKIEMTKNADGTYTLSNQELAAEAEFKIIKVSDETTVWYGGEGNSAYWLTADNHTGISLIAGDTPNFYMPIEGTWTFTVDPTGNAPTLTVDGDWPVRSYYLAGDFNEWSASDSYKFTVDESTGKYTLSTDIKINQSFKILDSDGKWYGAISNGDFWVEEDQCGTALSLDPQDGSPNFLMKLSNKNKWDLELSPDIATLTLSNFVSDVAELPFEFDGGRSDIQNTAGLTNSGIGSDYSSSPKLKFTTTGDALVLHFDERPGTLTFDIKGNGFSGGTFVVQTSVDGENYSDLQSYTSISGSVQSEEFTNLGEDVRYIKWLYKVKDNGNVALGNIKLEKYEEPESYTLTISENDNAEIFVFYNDPDNNYPAIEDGDEVLATSEILVSISASEGYQVESLTVTKEDGQAVTLTAEEDGISWTFIMPSSDVTVACTVKEEEEPSDEVWVLTNIADLSSDDIFVIVGDNGNTYAMSNDEGTGNPPVAVAVTIEDDKVTSNVADNLKWNISGNDTDGYTFYPNGDTENWLYCTNGNNGVRVGTNTNKLFTIIADGYLKHNGTNRYVGIYNSQDWRCYSSYTGTSNIAGQTFAFYKYVKPEAETFEFSINELATDGTDCYATISALGEGNWKVVGDVEVSTVVVENDVLTYPKVFGDGDLIPGDGAFLVKGAAGDYTFEKSASTEEIDLGDNMLMSTGEGIITTTKPDGAGNIPYLFYKLARNANNDLNSVGFYFGADNGAAFIYNKGHQAYLAVPNPTGSTPVQSFSFDGTNGINDIVTTAESNNEVYTLSGMRVNSNQLTKGLYIVNGKKMVIK